MNPSDLKAFIGLFKGYECAHGEHLLEGKADETGKIKGEASTKGEGATEKHYINHLTTSNQSLGIIPLLKDNTCAFGAIDIDVKGDVVLKETLEELEDKVRKYNMPLVVFRSKSGGAHCYMFCDPPIPAKLVIDKLTEFAALLGYAGCEVFPKQSVRVDESDRGNWINIAMQGCESESGTIRWCMRNGEPIKDLSTVIKYAMDMRVCAEDLREIKTELNTEFNDAPPCLQHIISFGIGDGSRNVTLYNMGVFYKMQNEDGWIDDMVDFNEKHLMPPVPKSEVDQIIKNVGKKEYYYTCKKPPIVNHCNRGVCVRRKFGVNHANVDSPLLQLNNLCKHISREQVMWYLEFQGARIRVDTETLMAPTKLAGIFLEKFSILLPKIKKQDWDNRLTELLSKCSEVSDPDDASFEGQLDDHIDAFLTGTRPARNINEVINGNPYIEEGKIYFRSSDLIQYLAVRNVKVDAQDLWHSIAPKGGSKTTRRVHGKPTKLWCQDMPQFYDGAETALPKAENGDEIW